MRVRLPDSLRLGHCEVEKRATGCLHAGSGGQCHPAAPLEGIPALRQEVHQQRRGFQREQHFPRRILSRQVGQSRQDVPEERDRGPRRLSL